MTAPAPGPTDADRAKAAEGWMPPDEGCTCGQTSLLADHAASCALMLCRRCGMELPDHLPGDDRCHPACGRPHLDDPAIAAALAAERETALAPVLAHAAAKLRDEVTREIAGWMAAPHEPEQWQIDNADDLAANLLTGPLAALVASALDNEP